MVPALDAGPVILALRTPVADDETAGELQLRLAELGAVALIEALALLPSAQPTGRRRTTPLASYAKKIVRDDARRLDVRRARPGRGSCARTIRIRARGRRERPRSAVWRAGCAPQRGSRPAKVAGHRRRRDGDRLRRGRGTDRECAARRASGDHAGTVGQGPRRRRRAPGYLRRMPGAVSGRSGTPRWRTAGRAAASFGTRAERHHRRPLRRCGNAAPTCAPVRCSTPRSTAAPRASTRATAAGRRSSSTACCAAARGSTPSIDERVRGGLVRLDPDLIDLLRLGAQQLFHMGSVPAYAAIGQTVELAKQRHGIGASKLANAVLRRLDRERDALKLPDPRRSDRRARAEILASALAHRALGRALGRGRNAPRCSRRTTIRHR